MPPPFHPSIIDLHWQLTWFMARFSAVRTRAWKSDPGKNSGGQRWTARTRAAFQSCRLSFLGGVENCFLYSPDIHVPLNRGSGGSLSNMSSSVGLRPLTLGPSSGGETSTILKTINPNTATMTSSAMKIPRQFLSFGELTTSSCNKKLTTMQLWPLL